MTEQTTMTHFLHTQADLAAALRTAASPPTRASRRCSTRPAARTCGGAKPAFPASRASSAASNCRPRARARSGAGCKAPSIRSITTRCAARAPTSSAGSACRPPRSSRSRRSRKAIAKGELDLDAVANSDADAAHQALIALHGIGPWTADIYLLFCLGHADAWPAGDLALQEAARIAFGAEGAPDAEGDDRDRRSLAALSRRGRASALGLLSRGEAARRRRHPDDTKERIRTRRNRRPQSRPQNGK